MTQDMAKPTPPPSREDYASRSAAALHTAVLQWYAGNARDLPWRHAEASPWGVLVSEVMLQQTPVARVERTWREWLRRWPTPAALAAEPAGEAVRAWGRLGYPRRALRLHEAATAIGRSHGGVVPEEEATLRSLPGVGAYTAAAVAAFAYGRRTTVVDTNVRRVQARVVSGAALPAPALTAAESRLAERLTPSDRVDSVTWNVACMELGALVCTAAAPRCAVCPIAGQCAWRLAGCPPYDGPPRRGQAWHGTDRQCRGAMLAVLRQAPADVAAADLAVAWPDEPEQRARALAALIEDGLVEPLPGDRYRLPV